MSRTLKRFGRVGEGKAVRWFGDDIVDAFKVCSSGLTVPVPVAGAPMCAYRGDIIPWCAGGGFTSGSDMLAEATAGKRQQLILNKTGVTAPAVSATQHLWAQGALPTAGANMAAAPGGTVPTRATTGALGQQNPDGGDTQHIVGAWGVSTVAGAILIYDYLVGVNINHATTANTVTGAQTRYTGAAGTPEYPAGVFISGRVSTVLGATAHSVTVTYTDQDNNAGAATTAAAVRVSSAVQTTPLTQPVWTLPLASGDRGVRQITNIALSAASTGNVDWFLGMPLLLIPCQQANVPFYIDGAGSEFNLAKVMDGACLAAAEFFKTATTAATVNATIITVSG